MRSSEDILSLLPPKADQRIAYGTDPNQFVELRFPKPPAKSPHPVLINIHGGFWRAQYGLEHAGHVCAALANKGIATANIEYRRVGNRGGGWPYTFEDIRTAYNFLLQHEQQYKFDKKRIMIMGHSAGGHLALCLAAHEPAVQYVVSLAGVVNLEQAYELHLSNDAVVEFMGGIPSAVPDHYYEADPMRLSISARQWLIHGAEDSIVIVQFSREYVKVKHRRNEKVDLVEIPDADHFDVIDPRSYAWSRIESLVVKTLA